MNSFENKPEKTETRTPDAFMEMAESGVVDEIGTPENTIVGILSKVFVRGERVFKIYKHAQTYYGDLQSLESRRSFYTDDFEWNKITSPHIYKRLVGVSKKKGRYVETQLDDAEDFYIEMERYDDSRLLTNMLKADSVSQQDIESVIVACSSAHVRITRALSSKYSHLISEGWQKLFLRETSKISPH